MRKRNAPKPRLVLRRYSTKSVVTWYLYRTTATPSESHACAMLLGGDKIGPEAIKFCAMSAKAQKNYEQREGMPMPWQTPRPAVHEDDEMILRLVWMKMHASQKAAA